MSMNRLKHNTNSGIVLQALLPSKPHTWTCFVVCKALSHLFPHLAVTVTLGGGRARLVLIPVSQMGKPRFGKVEWPA